MQSNSSFNAEEINRFLLVVDGSLGKLVVFLRLMGYNTILAKKNLITFLSELPSLVEVTGVPLSVINHELQVIVITPSSRVRTLLQRPPVLTGDLTSNSLVRQGLNLVSFDVLVVPHDVVGALRSLHEHGVRVFIPESIRNSRCSKCNGRLRVASKEEILRLVKAGSRDRYTDFYVCVNCGQPYWVGSHWRRIRETINKALGV